MLIQADARVIELRIGRAYCPRCQASGTVVRHPEVVEVHCPHCGAVCQPEPDDGRTSR